MRSPFFHGVGGVVSADIAVPDHEREVDFYAKILTTGSTPLWREDLTNNHGTPIIGLGARAPEYEALPVQWMPHFQVADVAQSASRSVRLGGQELMHGKADTGQSQWAVLVDPNGAAFGVIPVVDAAPDASQLDHIGHIAWLTLLASDVALTSAFYEQVVGWSAADAGGKCDMQRADGEAAAEICPLDEATAGVPAVWLLHLPVDDFSESLQQVRQYGGEVLRTAPGDEYAVIRDPVGVHLALQPRRS